MVWPQAGTPLHDPASNNFGLLAKLNRNGRTMFSFDPPVGYRYSLEVGKAWASTHPLTVQPSCEVRPCELRQKVEAQGSLTVSAGTFQTYRILITDNFGQVDRYWISPETGIPTIKHTQTRPVTHPQGAGQLDDEPSSLKVAKQRRGAAAMTCQLMVALHRLRYRAAMQNLQPVGTQLREWRQRRRLSQLDLAGHADVSTRHLSFMETGRSLPSREMVLRLADRLQVPLRERNRLLTAAGYAPLYAEHKLDDPALQAARQAVELVLRAHEPCPALAVDRHWNLVSQNRMLPLLLADLPPELLAPPLNVLRLSLHPKGLAPRIVNLASWRAHLLHRLLQQVQASADPMLAALEDELRGYPAPPLEGGQAVPAETSVYLPLQLRSSVGVLNFISTVTVFGTATDITLSELAMETLFPADAATMQALRQLADTLR
jgi:transcriptional regulator with XRE-family HTH domain